MRERRAGMDRRSEVTRLTMLEYRADVTDDHIHQCNSNTSEIMEILKRIEEEQMRTKTIFGVATWLMSAMGVSVAWVTQHFITKWLNW
jgi:hypothetical protein